MGVDPSGSCLASPHNCSGFAANQFFTCIHPNEDDPVCAPGCRVCYDTEVGFFTKNAVMVGDFNPHRWMRPHPTFPSRDAWGRFAPLRSGVVTLLPAYASTWWDRAPCFFMDGHECFDDSYCDCHPTRANTFAGPSGGCCETPECRKMVTAIGDCHVYSGNQFPPFLSCRQTNQRGVLTVQATAERMRQIITVRLGAIGVCHANALIPATARVITSSCLGSFYGSWLAAHPQGPSPPGVLQRR